MQLYVVTDRSWLNGKCLVEQVEETLKAGATFIQLREKDISHEVFIALAREVKALTDYYKVPFVINDDIEVALEIDADGVHIGQEDMTLLEAREKLGPDKIIGVSAHNLEEAMEAEALGANYLGVGAVFNTSTKLDASTVGLETLKEICSHVTLPVVAIGGISKNNIMKLSGTGVDGVAVISAIFAQPDITRATQELLTSVRQMVGGEII